MGGISLSCCLQMKLSVRMNGMYLTYKILLIETLYYELYYYGY